MQRDRKSADESEIKTTAKKKLGDYRERRKMECESERWRERKERFFPVSGSPCPVDCAPPQTFTGLWRANPIQYLVRLLAHLPKGKPRTKLQLCTPSSENHSVQRWQTECCRTQTQQVKKLWRTLGLTAATTQDNSQIPLYLWVQHSDHVMTVIMNI